MIELRPVDLAVRMRRSAPMGRAGLVTASVARHPVDRWRAGGLAGWIQCASFR
jgi:hypothetical protein